MRKILFRGKRTDNGEWVTGWLFDDGMVESKRFFVGDFVITDHCGIGEEQYDIGYSLYEVEPSTVGQFTGLLDKNGTKIFEGDILLPPGEDAANLRLVVVFEKGCWTLRVPDWCWLFDTPLYEFGGEVYLKIGNIHDNPSMLEKEETK